MRNKRKPLEGTDKAEEDYDASADNEAEMSPDGGSIGARGLRNNDMEDADWYRQKVGKELERKCKDLFMNLLTLRHVPSVFYFLYFYDAGIL